MTAANSPFTLGSNERIKSRKLIESLFREGKLFNQFPYRVLYKFTTCPAPPLQAGFAVSSRHFKKAVDRNRIKRLTREAYRLQKPILQAALQQATGEQKRGLAVFFIYTGKELPDFTTVSRKMGQVLEQLTEVVNSHTP